MIHKRIILKRSLFCGIFWLFGSLQYLVNPNTSKVLYFLPLIIGTIQCVLSFNYQNKTHSTILKVILIIQIVYYLVCLGYIIVVIADYNMKILGCLLSVCMLALTVSIIYTLWKYDK